jgi:hypothetical protein
MRKEYDFSKGKRGAVLPSPAKVRITIMLETYSWIATLTPAPFDTRLCLPGSSQTAKVVAYV